MDHQNLRRIRGFRRALLDVSVLTATRVFVYCFAILVIVLLARYVLTARFTATSADVPTDLIQKWLESLFTRIGESDPHFAERLTGFFDLAVNSVVLASVIVSACTARWDMAGILATVVINSLLTSVSCVPFYHGQAAISSTTAPWFSVTSWDPNPYICTSITLLLLSARALEVSATGSKSLTTSFVITEAAYMVSLLGRGRVCTIGAINSFIAFIAARSLVVWCDSTYRRLLMPVVEDPSFDDLSSLPN